MAASSSTPTSSSIPSVESVRKKKDPAWEFATEIINNGRRSIKCGFCDFNVAGGGINRFKQHLAGIKGQVQACKKVPEVVKFQIFNMFKEVELEKKEKKNENESHYGIGSSDVGGDDDVQEIPNVSKRKKDDKKRGAPSNISDYFSTQTTSQPTLQAVWQSPQKTLETDMALARWFYDACIPFNAVNSAYFQPAIERVASMGVGYRGPSYNAMRVNLLDKARQEVQLLVDTYRRQWEDTGCTIMGDGWTDSRHRSLINFLVYCPRGISFIKSVDSSNFVNDATTLCGLFSEIVEMVGPRNVIHMVTDNGANYKAAGQKLCMKYPFISWSPCAAHCVNLILKDIGELPQVNELASKASKITCFVYNCKWVLAWCRRKEGWREITRPGPTRFATTFITFKSLYDHKSFLQSLMVDEDFHMQRAIVRKKKTVEAKAIILDENFWKHILCVVRITDPLIRLLRLADSDEKPALGYIYEGMYRARRGIKEIFQNKKKYYKPYTTILKERWDKQLRQNIHAAAYFLNPAFQFDKEIFCKKPEVMSGLLDVIEKKVDKNLIIGKKTTMVDEVGIFRDRLKSFERQLALDTSKTTRPDEWWRLFGHSTPNLQKLAIRLLSQTASSSGCERNWSVFERVHTKRRNRLEHQRLQDLVYVHYNFRLAKRMEEKKRPYDPIDYECINDVDFWVLEDENDGELDVDELENMLDNEDANDDIGVSTNPFGDQELPIDISSFVGGSSSHLGSSEDEGWLPPPPPPGF